MKKTVMDTICSSFDSFFDSEKKIAKYIINNYDKVVEMTVGQLASASGSSEASVSRFCKKIGVKGFHHLKISLAKEMVESNLSNDEVSNRISIDDIEQSLQNILANKVEELKQTISMLNIENFKNTCTVMNGTLAWDISGKMDESDCIDIDPFTLYELKAINSLIA